MHMVRQVWGTRKPSVLIIGSGLSGAMLAVLLRDADTDVTLLEQVIPPGRAHTFHGIVDTWDWRALGIDPPLDQLQPVPAVERWSLGESRASETVSVDGWASIEHRALLRHLVGTAVRGGVRFVRDATVAALIPSGRGYSGVRTEDGQVYSADVIVFADESDPRVPEMLGLRPDWAPTQQMHIGKLRYDLPLGATADRFGLPASGMRLTTASGMASWGSPCWLTITPGLDAFTVAAAMLLEDEMANARHIREVLDELEPIQPLLPLVRDLSPAAFTTEVVPIAGFGERLTLSDANVIVASDLVGVTHPLNRDGLSTNLALCVQAARTVREAIGSTDPRSALEGYSRQVVDQVIAPVAHQRRASLERRRQPEWQWASKPGLVVPVTNPSKSATLSPQRVLDRFRRS